MSDIIPPPMQDACNPNELWETRKLLNTLLINVGVWIVLVCVFEFNRQVKSIYQKRGMKDKFVRAGRVPPEPGKGFLGWVWTINTITEDGILQMVGLDGYMLIRYINICFHITLVISILGVCVLAPFYGNSGGGRCAWAKYTLGNVPMGDSDSIDGWSRLWAPAIFAYIFSGYYCLIMYNEYHNFLEKRVAYLQRGDPDTPTQAYYTVMVEKIPASLRSAQNLAMFFDNLFPGEVYSVQLAADLHELDALVLRRRKIRDWLEKAIALWEASERTERTMVWVRENDLHEIRNTAHRAVLARPRSESEADRVSSYALGPAFDAVLAGMSPVRENASSAGGPLLLWRRCWRRVRDMWEPTAALLGFRSVDAIDYYSGLLQELNDRVHHTQHKFLREETHVVIPVRQPGIRADSIAPMGLYEPAQAGGLTPGPIRSGGASYQHIDPFDATPAKANRSAGNGTVATPGRPVMPPTTTRVRLQPPVVDPASSNEARTYTNRSGGGAIGGQLSESSLRDMRNAASLLQASTMKIRPHSARTGGASEGDTADEIAEQPEAVQGGFEKALKVAVRGVLEATRTLELLTMGAHYRTSSTAFVTFSTRSASSSSAQMLLSHRHFTMSVKPAPNPQDIVWENVMIPQRQIDVRRTIADLTLWIGALLWSLVLGFITQIANVENLSRQHAWLRPYHDTLAYQLFSTYLSSSILLCLLAALPYMFNLIAVSYEGLKLKSELQSSIMTRYFYYQLANVFVAIYAGSIVSALQEIIDDPSYLFSILGSTIPKFSVYFVNLIVVKTFTAVPMEMLRIWPLIQILSLKMCLNRKTCTWRELRTGAFADPRVVYGWIYPSLMMVLMIVITYACISPLMAPLGAVYYAMTYYMYKYQLLYVFVNEYQSGGFMWYVVFSRSMIILTCAVVTVVCYLGFRREFNYGPFYFTLPLPVLILLFKNACERKFVSSSNCLSLESAIELDRATYAKRMNGFPADHSFRPKLFRQPSLADGPLRPGPYRPTVAAPSTDSPFRGGAGGPAGDSEVSPLIVHMTAANACGARAGVVPSTPAPTEARHAGMWTDLWSRWFSSSVGQEVEMRRNASATEHDGIRDSREQAALLDARIETPNVPDQATPGATYGSTASAQLDPENVTSEQMWDPVSSRHSSHKTRQFSRRADRRGSGALEAMSSPSLGPSPLIYQRAISPVGPKRVAIHSSSTELISDDIVGMRHPSAHTVRFAAEYDAYESHDNGDGSPSDDDDSGGEAHDEDGTDMELVTNALNEVVLGATDMGEIADVSELLDFPHSPFTSPSR